MDLLELRRTAKIAAETKANPPQLIKHSKRLWEYRWVRKDRHGWIHITSISFDPKAKITVQIG